MPNDESKYYLDYPVEIPKMLQVDFGKDIAGVDIQVSFQFFKFGNLNDRPYMDKKPKALKVSVKEIGSYFNNPSSEEPQTSFLRDETHNLNGWNNIKKV